MAPIYPWEIFLKYPQRPSKHPLGLPNSPELKLVDISVRFALLAHLVWLHSVQSLPPVCTCLIQNIQYRVLLGKSPTCSLDWGTHIGSDYGIACVGRTRMGGGGHSREQISGWVVTTCCPMQSTAEHSRAEQSRARWKVVNTWCGRLWCHSDHLPTLIRESLLICHWFVSTTNSKTISGLK